MTAQTRLRFGFNIFVVLFFAFTAYDALDFRTLARYLPLTVSVLGLIMASLALAIDWWNYRSHGAISYGDASETAAMSGYSAEPTETTQPADDSDGAVAPAAAVEDDQHPSKVLQRAGVFALWILGYVALIGIIGLIAATAVFLGVYLYFVARTGWMLPVIGIVVVLGGMYILKEALNLEWPEYLIAELLG